MSIAKYGKKVTTKFEYTVEVDNVFALGVRYETDDEYMHLYCGGKTLSVKPKALPELIAALMGLQVDLGIKNTRG